VRLNRFIARSGVCSRRQADELIKAGRVEINGETVTELGTQVQQDDKVVVGGSQLYIEEPVYLLLNKPKDTITTVSDDRGRRTVMDLLEGAESEGKGLFPVGRLDRDTTGALLVTNDGALAHRLMHPRWSVSKIYVVKTERPVASEELDRLVNGVELEDGAAAALAAGYVSPEDRRSIALEVQEGRNHLVRRMIEAIGHKTVALDRPLFAGLNLEGLRRGKWRRLRPSEIRRLRRLVRL
jgi:23S rRNA pseudouridine2605 synthase